MAPPASIISGVISISFAGAPAGLDSSSGPTSESGSIALFLSQVYNCQCSGFIEGDWKPIEGQAIFRNISTNNEHFTRYRTSYKPAFDLDKIATYDVSSHNYSQSLTPMLFSYDVLSATVQVCFAPYREMEMACTQEKTPPSK